MLADDGAAAGGQTKTAARKGRRHKADELERETRKGEGPAREEINGNPPVDGRPPLAQIAEEDAAQTERLSTTIEED